jgi:hypothetical protein
VESATPLDFLRHAAFEPFGFVVVGRGGASRYYAHSRSAAEVLRREVLSERREEFDAGAAVSPVLYCG